MPPPPRSPARTPRNLYRWRPLSCVVYAIVAITGLALLTNVRSTVKNANNDYSSPLHRVAGVRRRIELGLDMPRGVRIVSPAKFMEHSTAVQPAASSNNELAASGSFERAALDSSSVVGLLRDVWSTDGREPNSAVAGAPSIQLELTGTAEADTTGGRASLTIEQSPLAIKSPPQPPNCNGPVDPATSSLPDILCRRTRRPFRINPRNTVGNHKLAQEPDFELLAPSENADDGLDVHPPLRLRGTTPGYSDDAAVEAARREHEINAELAIVVVSAPRVLASTRDSAIPRYFRLAGACSSTEGLMAER
jgi:hypothetical protein